MAIIKLGSIVTGIRGSVGGTTFREIGGVAQMYNKSSGASSSRIDVSNGFLQLQTINAKWADLTQLERDDWSAEAVNFKRTDRFGDTYDYTGRQFFTSVNYFNYFFDRNVTDPKTINGTVQVGDLNIGFFREDRFLNFEFLSVPETFYTLMRIQICNSNTEPPIIKRYRALPLAVIGSIGNFFFQVDKKYLNAVPRAGNNAYFHLTIYNITGWHSPTITLKTVIT